MDDSSGAAEAHGRDAADRTSEMGPVFSERLAVPWFWWPLPLLAAVLLAAEVHMGYPGVRSWLPYAVTVPLVAVALFRLGRVRIEVRNGELLVGDARLPLEFVGDVEVLTAKDKRRALGRDLDPLAFVSHRAWVGPVIVLELCDPADPTPYWIFSARSAESLAEVLRQR